VTPQRPVVLVTAGHKRLGRAVALNLAEQGADVAVHYRSDPALAAEVVAQLQALGARAAAFQAELTDSAAVGQLLVQVHGQLGRLDWLVGCAASWEPTPLASLTAAQLDAVLQSNARAPVDLVVQALPWLRQSADARVVLFGDLAGRLPFSGYLAHSMAKAALHAAVAGLAAELGPQVAVNGIAPGAVLQPADMEAAAWTALQRRVPQGQLALADAALPVDAVAATVHFLLTAPRYLSGQIVAVDGGRTARW
jgi:pteridine reductase